MYGKVFASLYQGTLRGRAHEILVFTNLIASADREGIVDKHPRAIADEVGLSMGETSAALTNLEAPDPESRSPEMGGARIVRLDEHRAWGWAIVNYAKYRSIKNEEDRRAQTREAVRRHRERKKDLEKVPDNRLKAHVSMCKPRKAHADAEADVYTPPSPPSYSKKQEPEEKEKKNDGDGGDSNKSEDGDRGSLSEKLASRPGRGPWARVRQAVDRADLVGVIRAYGAVSYDPREWMAECDQMAIGVVAAIFGWRYGNGDPIRAPSGFRKARSDWQGIGEESRKRICQDLMARLGGES